MNRATPMEPVLERLDGLHASLMNERTHDERNVSAIAASLEEHGQVEPLLVRLEDRVLIAGHGRMEAMAQLGWTEANVLWLDIDESAAKRLRIRLNRTAELAGWDSAMLYAALADEGDIELLGFDIGDSRLLSRDLPDDEEVEVDDFEPITAEDVETKVRCPSCGYEW